MLLIQTISTTESKMTQHLVSMNPNGNRCVMFPSSIWCHGFLSITRKNKLHQYNTSTLIALHNKIFFTITQIMLED